MDRAEPGDRLVLPASPLDAQPLVATVIEVCGKDGRAPFLVRWEDLPSGAGTVTSLLFPCRGTRIEHASLPDPRSTGSADSGHTEPISSPSTFQPNAH